jgi:hypothetical protein
MLDAVDELKGQQHLTKNVKQNAWRDNPHSILRIVHSSISADPFAYVPWKCAYNVDWRACKRVRGSHECAF